MRWAIGSRWLPPGTVTPVPVVDLATARGNVERMARDLTSAGVTLRPHIKTHKSVRLARLELEAGAVGITCATLGEAQVMATGGLRDILVAYPVWPTASHAEMLSDILGRVDRLTIGADSPTGVRQLAEVLRAVPDESRLRIELSIEVDAGEGRTGVATPARAVEVARAARSENLNVTGVFTHGGHGYAGADAAISAARDEVDVLTSVVAELRVSGHEVTTISAGSTPTARHSARGVVTEERPGTFIFGDRQQVALGAIAADDVAMVVATRCVSREAAGRFILDAGAKSLTKDMPKTLEGFGHLPAYPRAQIISLYDHHAVCEIGDDARAPDVGETLALVPNHACPVINLFDEFLARDIDGKVEAWPVDARGRNC